MGTHKNRCLATFFERSTVRIPSIHTRRQIHTRLHTTLKKLRSETTLCIYCTRGQSHSLPFLRCVSQSATHITHTNIHVHHAPSTRFLTLESFLLSPIDNLYETNIPLFPSCSILASPRLESNPAMWTVVHPYRRSHVKRTFTCTLAAIFPYLKLLSTDRCYRLFSKSPSSSKYNCPFHVQVSQRVLSQSLSSIPWICPRKRTSVDIRNTCYA